MNSESLFIVDKKFSALWIAANSRTKNCGGKIISANEYATPNKLLQKILDSPEVNVYFTWRRALRDIYQTSNYLEVNKLNLEKSVNVVVADYMGLNPNFRKDELFILTHAHNCYVTNHDLALRYKVAFPTIKLRGIIYDLPDLDILNVIRNKVAKPKNVKPVVVWVGNSRWGKRLGFDDHKGFDNILKPLIKLIELDENCIDLKVFDSSERFIPNQEILRQIRLADILIQTSISEGTGLPLLEALGLETRVVTTSVGIAPELATKTKSIQIVDGNALAFHNKIHWLLNQTFDRFDLSVFNSYIDQNILLPMPNKGLSTINTENSISEYNKLRIKLYWFYRKFIYLKNQLKS